MPVPSFAITLMYCSGKGGSRIQEIQEESGAQINIQKDAEGPTTAVTLEGDAGACAKAKATIESIVNPGSGK